MLAVPELNVIATGDGLVAYVVKTSVPPTVPVAGAAQVIDGVATPIVIVSVACAAAFQFAFAAWSARTVQTPTAM
jgi:hypothetical protein